MKQTNTCLATLQGFQADRIAEMMRNRKLAASITNINKSLSHAWRLVESEADIIDMLNYYKAKANNLFAGSVGESIASNNVEWIQANRDKKAASLGCCYK